MRGISSKKKTPILHGLGNEAASGRDALLDHRPLDKLPRIARLGPRAQFLPDAVVRPLRDVLSRKHLDVKPRHLRRSHAEEGEAPLVIAVDELGGGRRALREHAEPGKRIVALVYPQHARRNGIAAHAVKTIATGHEPAPKLEQLARVAAAHARHLGIDVMQAHVLDVEEDTPIRGEPGADEILDDLLLRVHRDRAAAGQAGKVDAMAAPAEAQFDAAMNESLSPHAFSRAAFAKQVRRRLLEHTGANALLDVLPAAIFENDRLDALQMQEVRKQQPRRPGADYR